MSLLIGLPVLAKIQVKKEARILNHLLQNDSLTPTTQQQSRMEI